jgi:hypothetical protein
MRIAARATAIALIAPSSGCFAAPPPARRASTSPAEAVEPAEDLTSLTFEQGATLPEDAYVEWRFGLNGVDGWTLENRRSADPQVGEWVFANAENRCVTRFTQCLLDDTMPTTEVEASEALLIAAVRR